MIPACPDHNGPYIMSLFYYSTELGKVEQNKTNKKSFSVLTQNEIKRRLFFHFLLERKTQMSEETGTKEQVKSLRRSLFSFLISLFPNRTTAPHNTVQSS